MSRLRLLREVRRVAVGDFGVVALLRSFSWLPLAKLTKNRQLDVEIFKVTIASDL